MNSNHYIFYCKLCYCFDQIEKRFTCTTKMLIMLPFPLSAGKCVVFLKFIWISSQTTSTGINQNLLGGDKSQRISHSGPSKHTRTHKDISNSFTGEQFTVLHAVINVRLCFCCEWRNDWVFFLELLLFMSLLVSRICLECWFHYVQIMFFTWNTLFLPFTPLYCWHCGSYLLD